MSRPAVLLLLAVSHVTALKLLASNDGDENDDWESDIQFSYKPFSGACNDGGGNIATTLKKNDGYGKDAALSSLVCDKAVAGDKDFAAYCAAAEIKGKSNAQFDTILAEWIKVLVKAEEFKKCPHYYAKLATMSNAEMTKESKTKSGLILSFSVKMTDCTGAFYTEAATKGAASKDVFCYTTGGITWAKNDPKVKNIDGEEFEIMATGSFSLLKLLKKDSAKPSLEVLANVDRAGTRCGATYIQNVTLQGQWVEDVGVPQIQVRAESAVPKTKALQVNFQGTWEQSVQFSSNTNIQKAVREATAKKLILQFEKVDVLVSIDSHRIVEEGTKTKRFANFLNIAFDGIGKISGMSLGGLLGRDSHEAAAEIPQGCESTNLIQREESGMFSTMEVIA